MRTWKQFREDIAKMSPKEKAEFKQSIIDAYNFGPYREIAFLREKAKTKKLSEMEQWTLNELLRVFGNKRDL